MFLQTLVLTAVLHTPEGVNEDRRWCDEFASLSEKIATLRDDGVEKDFVIEAAMKAKKPQLILEVIDELYDSAKDQTPEQVKLGIQGECYRQRGLK